MDHHPSPDLIEWVRRNLSILEPNHDNISSRVAPLAAWSSLIKQLQRNNAPSHIIKEAELIRPKMHGIGVTRRSSRALAEPRTKSAEELDINPQPGSSTRVSDHGGAVTPKPQVYSIFVGPDWEGNIHGINLRALRLISAITDLCNDEKYMGRLQEYGVGMPIHYGSVYHEVVETEFYDGVFDSGFDVGNIIPGTYIPNFLKNVLETNRGVALHPSFGEANLVYLLFLSTSMSLKVMAAGNKVVGGCNVDRCGYHGAAWYHKDIFGIPFGDPNLFYAVICGGDADNLVTVSHELVETFTDRIPGRGWLSGLNSNHEADEIGDICNNCSDGFLTTSRGQTVASYWLKSANRCLQQPDVVSASNP